MTNTTKSMKLIADSGSTKTEWCLLDGNAEVARFNSQGMNPYQMENADIRQIIAREVAEKLDDATTVSHVYFYGAGCRRDMVSRMRRLLASVFTSAGVIEVSSDLLAAARALLGEERGVACILGTGSNSCLYDGREITANVPPLGYILGDEGSGAVLGKLFLNALLKGRLPETLLEDYQEETGFSVDDIIRRVYREPLANRFLAATSPFIHSHLGYDVLREIVTGNFRSFFRNNVSRYGEHGLTVSALGGMASHYEQQLRDAARLEGYNINKVMKTPMDGLVVYHGKGKS